MKPILCGALALLLLAGPAAAVVEQNDVPGQLRTATAVVELVGGSPAVRVDGQLVYLAGAVVYNARGGRIGSAVLTAGKPVKFTITADGMQKIREVWTTD